MRSDTGPTRPTWLALLLLLTALACGQEPMQPEVEQPTIATVELSPAASTLTALGATIQVSATVLDSNGDPVSGASINWSTSDAAVASVDAGGLVTAAGDGDATITGAVGSVSGSTNITVEQVAATVALSETDLVFSALGATTSLAATVEDASGNPIVGAQVTWASSDDGVASVDADGRVTAAGNGDATVTASAGTASGSATVTVEQRAAAVVLSESELAFSGLDVTSSLVATAEDASGNPIAGPEVAWSSSNDQVATVDADGLVTTIGDGESTITATVDAASGSATVTVQLGPDQITLSDDFSGGCDQWTAEVTILAGNGGTSTESCPATGGSDDGAYLSMEASLLAHPVGGVRTVRVDYEFTGGTVLVGSRTPGAICASTLRFQEQRRVTGGTGVGFGAGIHSFVWVEQGGVRYVAGTGPNSATDWNESGADGPAGFSPAGLDLCPTEASTLTFGFRREGQALGFDYTLIHGVDEWSVTVARD